MYFLRRCFCGCLPGPVNIFPAGLGIMVSTGDLFVPLHNNIFFGQAYLLLFALLLEGYVAYKKGKLVVAACYGEWLSCLNYSRW